jgi:hypothetical protein
MVRTSKKQFSSLTPVFDNSCFICKTKDVNHLEMIVEPTKEHFEIKCLRLRTVCKGCYKKYCAAMEI